MNDGKLLELAAKAARVSWVDGHVTTGLRGADGRLWNPLTDDGDALRLAVTLALFESFDFTLRMSAACSEDDPHAATRRAIVRAAAEIGKAMP